MLVHISSTPGNVDPKAIAAGLYKGCCSDINRIAELEQQVKAVLRETADQLAHSECLDDEQRAEVHEILQALRHDTHAHCDLLGKLTQTLSGEAARA